MIETLRKKSFALIIMPTTSYLSFIGGVAFEGWVALPYYLVVLGRLLERISPDLGLCKFHWIFVAIPP